MQVVQLSSMHTWVCVTISTGWRRPIGCLKLQVIFRKRATNYCNYWALLRNMTYQDKASYGFPPSSTYICTSKMHAYIQKSMYKSTQRWSRERDTQKKTFSVAICLSHTHSLSLLSLTQTCILHSVLHVHMRMHAHTLGGDIVAWIRFRIWFAGFRVYDLGLGI